MNALPKPMKAALFGLIFGLLAMSCSEPLSPILPRWDTDLNIPLIAQTYTMEELLSSDSSLLIYPGADNILILRKEFLLRSVALGDNLKLDDSFYHGSEILGNLKYDIPELIDKDIYVGTVFPSLQQGSQVVQPQTNDQGVNIQVDARQYFTECVFDDGSVTIRLTNNLPIPINFPAPLRLLDATGNELGRSTLSGQVAPGETKTFPSISLKNITLKNAMSLAVTAASPGSGGKTVDVKSTDGVHIAIAVEKTKIRSAIAYLPAQHAVYEEEVDITNGNGLLQQGYVTAGQLKLKFKPHIPVGAVIDMTVDGVTLNGQPIRQTINLVARSEKTVTINLTGAILAPRNGKYLSYHIDLTTAAAQSQPVSIFWNDSVSVSAELTGLRFSQLTGVLATTEKPVNQSQKVDFSITSKLKGDILFSQAKMWATLHNTAFFPVDITNTVFRGTMSRTNVSAQLPVPYTRIQGKGETTVPFNDNDVLSFLNTFHSEFPDLLSVNGSILLNPTGAAGTATSADSVTGYLYVEIPMQFNMKSGEITDTGKVTMDKDSRAKIDKFNSGHLILDLENHLPAEMTVSPEILDKNHTTLLAPKTSTGENIVVRAAEIDAYGKVSKSTKQMHRILLKEEDFKKLMNSQWIKVRLFMNTPSTGTVAFRTTDYFKIRAYATVNVNSDLVVK